MKLAHLASHLYPRWWRERYGQEFAALLDDARPGLAGAFDIAKGAITMQLTTWSPGRTMLASLALGLVASAAVLAAWPREFESYATLTAATLSDSQSLVEQVKQVAEPLVGREASGEMLDRFKLYPEDLDRESAIRRFRNNVYLAPVLGLEGTKPALTISFRHSDPGIARQVAEELSNRMVAAMPGLWKELDGPAAARQTTPNALGIMGMSTAASIAIGGLLALFLMWKRRRKTA